MSTDFPTTAGAFQPSLAGAFDAFVAQIDPLAAGAASLVSSTFLGGGGRLLLGRKTYELMASYWPTPQASQNDPEVAKGMNSLRKVVFSRTLDKATWINTKLVKGDLAEEVRRMKKDSGDNIAILGSGSIVSQLAKEGLIDEYQIVVYPIVLGKGRTLFDGVQEKVNLKRTRTRAFRNGNVLLCYEPAA